jgi:hypothetical protein
MFGIWMGWFVAYIGANGSYFGTVHWRDTLAHGLAT